MGLKFYSFGLIYALSAALKNMGCIILFPDLSLPYLFGDNHTKFSLRNVFWFKGWELAVNNLSKIMCWYIYCYLIFPLRKWHLWVKNGERSLLANIWQLFIKWNLISMTFFRCQHCLDNFSKCKHISKGLSTEIILVGLKDLQKNNIKQEEIHEAVTFLLRVLLLSLVWQIPVCYILSTELYSKHLYC